MEYREDELASMIDDENDEIDESLEDDETQNV